MPLEFTSVPPFFLLGDLQSAATSPHIGWPRGAEDPGAGERDREQNKGKEGHPVHLDGGA
jgi:hypothetical protein